MIDQAVTHNPKDGFLEALPRESVIHFVGIGGVGMSALAQALQHLGYHVQGSDLSKSAYIDLLRAKGISVFDTHHADHIQSVAGVVTSSAIDPSNPEITAAQALGLSIIKRGDLLGELTTQKSTIGITGSHGKTTTTSLIGNMLVTANLDPLVLAGGLMHDYASNAYLGNGDWMVTELDESDGTHERAQTHIGVITNIDQEHMEFYKTKDVLLKSFETFLNNITPQGIGLACYDNPLVQEILQGLPLPVFTYGCHDKANVFLHNTRSQPSGCAFDVRMPDGTVYSDLELSLYGHHNLLNAGAVLGVAFHLGLSESVIREALRHFKGVKRRFNQTGTAGSIRFIDDYAHHPVEIRATLHTARSLCKGRLYAVCQPHRYTRLQDLFNEFGGCFSDADETILVPVHSAGEKPIAQISSEVLAEALQKKGAKARHIETFQDVTSYLKSALHKNDMVVCMGAGTITQLAHSLPKAFTTDTPEA